MATMITEKIEVLRWWVRKKGMSWVIAIVLTAPVAVWLLGHGWREAVSWGEQHREYEAGDIALALAELHSPEAEIRAAALERIVKRSQQPLSSEQTAAIIRAATLVELEAENLLLNYDVTLIKAAGRWLTNTSVRALTKHYRMLGDGARFEALVALRGATISDRTRIMLELLRTHGYPASTRPFSDLFGADCPPGEVERELADGSVRGLPAGAAEQLRLNCAKER